MSSFVTTLFFPQIQMNLLMPRLLAKRRSLPVTLKQLPVQRELLPVKRRSLPVKRWQLPVDQGALPAEPGQLLVKRGALPDPDRLLRRAPARSTVLYRRRSKACCYLELMMRHRSPDLTPIWDASLGWNKTSKQRYCVEPWLSVLESLVATPRFET
jgi:hypothetical protein